MSEKTKEVMTKEEKGVSIDVKDAMFSGSGFEGTTSESYAIPIMKIAQELSGVMKKGKPDYNADAELGDFYNPSTGELAKELNVRVLSIEQQLVVWKPKRGGLVGVHLKKRPEVEKNLVAKQDGVQKFDADGNSVVDTLMFTCCMADDLSTGGLFFMPFAMSHLKYGKAWTSRLKAAKFDTKTFNPDAKGSSGASWLGVWNISTIKDSKDAYEWYTVGKTPKLVGGLTPDDLEAMGELLQTVKTSGKDYGSMENEHSESASVPQSTDQF